MKFIKTGTDITSAAIGLIPTTTNHLESKYSVYNIGYGIDLFAGKARYKVDDNDISKRLFPKETVRENDVITVEYQTVNKGKECHGELYVAKNEEELIQAFDNIPINGEEYRFGIRFWGFEDTVQLLQ